MLNTTKEFIIYFNFMIFMKNIMKKNNNQMKS